VLNVILFYSALIAGCAYALARGGSPERIGAGILIAGTMLSGLVASSARPGFLVMEAGILLVDTAMLVAFLVLALRSRRYWPLWMTALFAVQAAGHLAKLANPAMMPWAYAVAQGIWSYPIIAVLVIGTRRHQRRLASQGADASWVTS
jgi:hypothetical protein